MKPRRADRCEDRSLSFLYSDEELISSKEKLVSLVICSTMRFKKAVPQLSQTRFTRPASVQQDENKGNALAAQDDTGKSIKSKTLNELRLNSLLKDLYQILLEPVRQYVVGSQAVIVPDGPLALVPFAALVDENGNYVAESLRVRLHPSLTVGKMIREHPEEPPGRASPLIVGDPDVGTVKKGDKEFHVERLPLATKEVELIGTMLNVEPLVGERATKQLVLKKIENASLIHIAAHGAAARGEILLAPLCGTKVNNIKDVMLVMSDLEDKRLKAKLVVLSCCHSGRGKVTGGEGVVGIARAFLGAGARAVLAALWAVDDGATACFMGRFYEHLVSGESASEALNKAIKSLREYEGFQHPRYWAPFVLIGESVTPFVKPLRPKS